MTKGKLPVQKQQSKSTAMPTPDKDWEQRERKYKAEDALRTLQRAEEIKSDKGLMKDCKALANTQMKALGKI